ncbi:hypothetical protein QJQ45_018442 [Haematococcus lacustris]|nr:hypothetical protein QJQ45_018442 [Haematococcus lacustris]
MKGAGTEVGSRFVLWDLQKWLVGARQRIVVGTAQPSPSHNPSTPSHPTPLFYLWRCHHCAQPLAGQMITYCPTCGNMCLVELTAGSRDLRYFCQACPYIYTIKQKLSACVDLLHPLWLAVVLQITTHVVLAKKEVDDVLGGDETWKAAARTDANCPRCSYHQAYFIEIQIRSADEPATLFFKCADSDCGHQWKEG